MIKILTGYSQPGGSTFAFLNLAKEFIKRGYETELWGPHKWHLKQGSFCKPFFSNSKIKANDRLILHYMKPPPKFSEMIKSYNCRTVYSCHEMWWFDFKKVDKFYDTVQFVTKEQAEYHNSVKDYVIIPNVREDIKISRPPNVKNIAGIIGSIEPRKKTHISIKRALNDGCDKIIIYGPVQGKSYFDKFVKPLLSSKVVLGGFESKETIYSSIDRVYHSSVGEVASLVKDECYTTNTLFFGNEHTKNEVSTWTNDQIIDKWKEVLKL